MLCSSRSVMDCAPVTQSLDSLWFYTNILTCSDSHVAASFTDQRAPRDRFTVTEARNASFLLNQQNDQPENVESMIPRCTKCGGVSTAFKAGRVTSKSNDNSEVLESGREREEKREKRKRKKKKRSGVHGIKVILGGLELGFGVDGFLGFQESCGYDHMPAVQQQITRILPPFDDDVAMKKHLRLWAYAVACSMHCKY